MDNVNWWRATAISALVIVAAITIGVGAYNVGLEQGMVDSGRAIASEAADTAWRRGHRGSWFPVSLLAFFFLFSMIMRGWWWGGPWRRWYGHGYGWGPGCRCGCGRCQQDVKDETDPRR